MRHPISQVYSVNQVNKNFSSNTKGKMSLQICLILFLVCLANCIEAYRGLQATNFLKTSIAAASWKITIIHEGVEKMVTCSESESVLDACLDAGIELPYDCKLGVCLTCPSKIVSGTPDSTGSTLDDSVSAKGFALTCCTFPRSDMVIRTIEEEELVGAQFSGRT